jgi:hypothetical protein
MTYTRFMKQYILLYNNILITKQIEQQQQQNISLTYRTCQLHNFLIKSHDDA